jgi:FkbM family methyltransferase
LQSVSELGDCFATVGPSGGADLLGVKMRPELSQPTPAEIVNTQIWEWLALIDAVDDAERRFTMVELGAGCGHWTVHAAAALRRYRPGVRYRLVAVEAEPSHFRDMTRHLRDNGVRRWSRAGSCRAIRAAVSGRTVGREPFYVGNARRWYGQALVRPENEGAVATTPVELVPTIRLSTLLRRLGPVVDLVDMDIQGAELEVLDEARAELGRVRRLYVETHFVAVHEGVRAILEAAEFEPVADVPLGAQLETPFGHASFAGGGVLSYRRPPRPSRW